MVSIVMVLIVLASEQAGAGSGVGGVGVGGRIGVGGSGCCSGGGCGGGGDGGGCAGAHGDGTMMVIVEALEQRRCVALCLRMLLDDDGVRVRVVLVLHHGRAHRGGGVVHRRALRAHHILRVDDLATDQ
eukprot:6203632-Pleurochrysis_carterae.AAC.2